jgi:hypothetical protein
MHRRLAALEAERQVAEIEKEKLRQLREAAESRRLDAEARAAMAEQEVVRSRAGPCNRPISVYRLGDMPIQSCGQSVSAPRGEARARLSAHTELRAKSQRSAREAIYRYRPITMKTVCMRPYIL